MITRELLRAWDACYDDERIAELVPEIGLTPLQVAALDIPAEDRLWVLLREEIIPARELRLLACRWARQAMALVPESERDPRSLAAIETAERFARGEATAAELNAAGAAGSSCGTAGDVWAASSAAWAASSAAWAASSAACDAAWYAARDSDGAAARAAQLADVVDVLHKLEAA